MGGAGVDKLSHICSVCVQQSLLKWRQGIFGDVTPTVRWSRAEAGPARVELPRNGTQLPADALLEECFRVCLLEGRHGKSGQGALHLSPCPTAEHRLLLLLLLLCLLLLWAGSSEKHKANEKKIEK